MTLRVRSVVCDPVRPCPLFPNSDAEGDLPSGRNTDPKNAIASGKPSTCNEAIKSDALCRERIVAVGAGNAHT